jgi:glucokinase
MSLSSKTTIAAVRTLSDTSVTRLADSRVNIVRLIGDIGGTNARFGWQAESGAPITFPATYRCEDFPCLQDAISHYLSAHALPNPQAFALGVATPVTGDQVRMTNHHWSFSISQLRKSLGVAAGVVVNDFVALASAIPELAPKDVTAHSTIKKADSAPIALLGPGTGLGVATLLADGNGVYRAHAGEGGHTTLAAANDFEASVISVLREKFGHVSAERALSGPGLVALYEALCRLRGASVEALSPAEITKRATFAAHPLCVETVRLFTSFLGNVAGNLALNIGAFGGVYIGGGIVPRLGAQFDAKLFRSSFEAKGRFSGYLSRIPSFVITCESPALRGAACYLDQQLKAAA